MRFHTLHYDSATDYENLNLHFLIPSLFIFLQKIMKYKVGNRSSRSAVIYSTGCMSIFGTEYSHRPERRVTTYVWNHSWEGLRIDTLFPRKQKATVNLVVLYYRRYSNQDVLPQGSVVVFVVSLCYCTFSNGRAREWKNRLPERIKIFVLV